MRAWAQAPLTAGYGQCVDNGDMTMRKIDDSTMQWTWSGDDDNARATLRRHAIDN